MADIIPFRMKSEPSDDCSDIDVDLLTAVDTAIRDLRDITRQWGKEAGRQQAEECRKMLERAFDAAF